MKTPFSCKLPSVYEDHILRTRSWLRSSEKWTKLPSSVDAHSAGDAADAASLSATSRIVANTSASTTMLNRAQKITPILCANTAPQSSASMPPPAFPAADVAGPVLLLGSPRPPRDPMR
ncbi:unnamed protein product [Ectocarpus sp. 12 AP-2014]